MSSEPVKSVWLCHWDWALGASSVSIRKRVCNMVLCWDLCLLSPHRMLKAPLLQSGALVPPLLDKASHTCAARAAVSPEMVVVSESVRPRGLDFANQRKVVILRDVHGLALPQIARKVKNLAGKRPSRRTCGQYYKMFSHEQG